jgi:hypothetical protein
MRRREKAVSGMALNGDVVQHGVPQRLLYFADHTLGELGSGGEDTRRRLQAGRLRQPGARLRRLRRRTAPSSSMPAPPGRSSVRATAHGTAPELEARQREAIASLAPERLLDAYADWLAAPSNRVSTSSRAK